MKRTKHKTLMIVGTVLIFVILAGIGITKFCIYSYGSRLETISDIFKVNTGTEYIILSANGKYQTFLASDHWNCISALEKHGYQHTDTMGSCTIYENKDGNKVTLVATDYWCKLFHEYSFQNANGDRKIQDILSN